MEKGISRRAFERKFCKTQYIRPTPLLVIPTVVNYAIRGILRSRRPLLALALMPVGLDASEFR